MKYHAAYSRAFTIIELLIAISISTIMILILTNTYLGYMRTYNTQQTYISLARSTSSIMNIATRAAQQAKGITYSHTFGGTNYTTGSTTVIFQLPSIDVSGNAIAGTYDFIGIYASGTDAYTAFDQGSGSVRGGRTAVLTSHDLSDLTFIYSNADPTAATKLDIYVTASSTRYGYASMSYLHQQVYMRNK